LYKILANTTFLGKSVIYLPSCHSTNAYASDLVGKGVAENGFIVITDHQTRGKGQQGNVWEAEPDRNLTFSFVLQPENLPANKQFDLNMFTTLGILDFLKGYQNISVKIKWPNDIYYHNQKICGILIANMVSGKMITDSVIGIGLNVNQRIFSVPEAVSMYMITGREYKLPVILEGLVLCIEKRILQYLKGGDLRADYLNNLFGLNEKRKFMRVKTGEVFIGQIKGIDQAGRLRVVENNVEHTFDFQEIKFLNIDL